MFLFLHNGSENETKLMNDAKKFFFFLILSKLLCHSLSMEDVYIVCTALKSKDLLTPLSI